MTGRLAAGVAAVWLTGIVLRAAAAGDIHVTPLVADGQVSASFDASGQFGEDAREVLRSGLLLTFTFGVELRRPSTIWFDQTLGSVTVASSAKFDNLTGVYQVSKLQDGRVVWSERTQDETSVRMWMTRFDRVLIPPAGRLEANADYYVRVRMQASPRRTFSLWPWSGDTPSGRADFTFLR